MTWSCIQGGTHGHTFGCDAGGTGDHQTVTRAANKHMRDTNHGTVVRSGEAV